MIPYEIEEKLILLSFMINIPCIGILINTYITKYEKNLYRKIVILSGIILYIILTCIENPFLAVGTHTIDPYGIESYIPITRISIAICPGIITVMLINYIRTIIADLIFFKRYNNWDKDYQPKLISKSILWLREKGRY